MGKAVVAAISLILVVGAVIGAVVIVKQHNNKNGSTASTGSSGIVTGMKAVETLCAPAYHPDLCKETLAPVVRGDANASPKAFLEASFQAILNAANQAMVDFKALEKDVKDKLDAPSMEVCNRYIGYMAEDLEISLSRVSNSDMSDMGVFARKLNIFLSAVLSYKSTCVEEMENVKLKEMLQGGVLLNTTKLTENGMDIVDGVAKFLGVTYDDEESDDGEELQDGKPNRRLLNIGEDEYPTWLSASDRKLLQAQGNPAADVIVAKDGSGQFETIQPAIDSCPENNKGRCVIHVKEGIYTGNVTVSRNNITMYGDGPTKTIITANLSYIQHIRTTSQTATVAVLKPGFMAKSMGFHNTAGPEGHQAVALLTKSENAVFYQCDFDGFQDTLYYQAHTSFFRECTIYGTIDFIFGRGVALIQNSKIIAKKPLKNQFNVLTADGKENSSTKTGLVIQNCFITGGPALIAEKNTIKTFLARPWGNLSTTVFMESDLSDIIYPPGYHPWNDTHSYNKTSNYIEFNNVGPGADTKGRVKWDGLHIIVQKQNPLKKYTADQWLPDSRNWLQKAGIPYDLGFTKPPPNKNKGAAEQSRVL